MRKTAVDRHYIYLRDQGICKFCGRHLKYGKMSLDHYLPHSAGGPDAIYNLVCSCKSCNNRKRSEVPEDWKTLWIQLFAAGVKDRKIMFSHIRQSYGDVLAHTEAIISVSIEGLNVIYSTKYKNIHVKQNSIVKITDINNEFNEDI